jgi:pimeloyl-ACP methyl ester carboxylesterase
MILLLKKWFGSKKAKLHIVSRQPRKQAVIFVHGLQGDAELTWKREGCPSFPELIREDLALQDFDIYSFEYKSNLSYSQNDFCETARILHAEIEARLKDQHLIFIAHSMGGLIVQQYIVDRIENGELQRMKQIQGIVYLSVPFEGSLLGNLFGRLHKQVRTLGAFSSHLGQLRDKWVKYCFRDGAANIADQMRFTIPQIIISGINDQVVPRHSAKPSHIEGKIFEVDEDHKSICKIDNNSTVYIHVKDFLLSKEITGQTQEAMVLWLHGWGISQFQEEAHYNLDLTSFFDIQSSPRMLPNLDTWRKDITPQLDWVVNGWAENWMHKSRKIRIYAKCCLSLGLLIGNRFSKPKGAILEVEHYGQIWKIRENRQSTYIQAKKTPGNSLESKKAILIISVSEDIEKEVLSFLGSDAMDGVLYKVVYNVLPLKGAGQTSIQNADDAMIYAQSVKQAAEQLKREGIQEILLFIKSPLSVAIFTGHYLTAVGHIQVFEYANPGYTPACVLS